MIQLSCKTRPCSIDNHYRSKKAACSVNRAVIHSSSAPAKLDKMASTQVATTRIHDSGEIIEDEGNINDSSDSQKLSAHQEPPMRSEIFETEVKSERTDTNSCTNRAVAVDETPKIGDGELLEGTCGEIANEDNMDVRSVRNVSEIPSKGENFEAAKLNESGEVPESQCTVPSDTNTSPTEIEISKEVEQSNTNDEKSLLSRMIEGRKKIASVNNSPKASRKQVNGTSEFDKESEASSSLAANLKKNFKNRFADVSIRFRKNEDTVNASEIRWQSENSEDATEPAKADGKRNILAAAQERGRAIFPELKNKLSGLSNRSPRMERKREWDKFIEESGCRTKIIQI